MTVFVTIDQSLFQEKTKSLVMINSNNQDKLIRRRLRAPCYASVRPDLVSRSRTGHIHFPSHRRPQTHTDLLRFASELSERRSQWNMKIKTVNWVYLKEGPSTFSGNIYIVVFLTAQQKHKRGMMLLGGDDEEGWSTTAGRLFSSTYTALISHRQDSPGENQCCSCWET